MQQAFDEFNRTFALWDISLSQEDLEPGATYQLSKRGWAIWLRLDADEAGEYLDYYASHRMTNDRHVRLRPGGSGENLPALEEGRLGSSDPIEDARLKQEFLQRQRETARLLDEKGFGLTGDEALSVGIRRIQMLEE